MPELSEMEMRIITELMEDWENIPTIVNTVTSRAGKDYERSEVREALRALIEGDLVLIALPPSAGEAPRTLSKANSLAIADDIEKHLRFDASVEHWTSDSETGPELALTDVGLEEAGSVLDRLPYRWWWPPG